jgi:hypothetical protein
MSRGEIIQEILVIKGNVNERERDISHLRVLLHAGLGFEMGQFNGAIAEALGAWQRAEHKVPDSHFGSSINQVHTLVVFAKIGFPKIRDAENAAAALHSSHQARRVVQISLHSLGTLLLKKSRRFRIWTASQATYLELASFQ